MMKTHLNAADQLKRDVRKKSFDDDSDDFAKGYDSTSSEDAELLMYQLENADLGKHVPGSKVAIQAHMIYENQKQKALEESHVSTQGGEMPDELGEDQLLDRTEMMNQFLKMSTRMSSSKNLRNFLAGVQLRLESHGVKIKIFTPQRDIVVNGVLQPFLIMDLDLLGAYLNFSNLDHDEELGMSFGGYLK